MPTKHMLTAALAVLLFLCFWGQASAQGCMVCVAGGGCPVCAERQVDGGAYCWTNGCTCQTGDWCVIIQGLLAPSNETDSKSFRLAAEPDMLRSLAEVDPYAAVAVAQLARNARLWDGHSQLYLPDVTLSAADIETWLLPGNASERFLRMKARRSRSGSLIVFSIDLQRTSDPNQRLLVIQRVGASAGDSAALAMDVVLGEDLTGARLWKVDRWFAVPLAEHGSPLPELR